MNDLAEADGATGGLGVEDRQVRTEEARLSLLARLQENLADKFLRFQKESDIRHLNFERVKISRLSSFIICVNISSIALTGCSIGLLRPVFITLRTDRTKLLDRLYPFSLEIF